VCVVGAILSALEMSYMIKRYINLRLQCTWRFLSTPALNRLQTVGVLPARRRFRECGGRHLRRLRRDQGSAPRARTEEA